MTRKEKQKRSISAKVKNVLITIVVLYVITLLGLFFLQRRLLFPRHMTHEIPSAGSSIEKMEKLHLDIPNGKIEAWFIPGKGADSSHPEPLVLFAHGNAELIDYWPKKLLGYQKMGINLLLPEYRGYGRSGGSPTEQDIAQDLAAWYDSMIKRPDVDPERIVFHGRSIGGGAVCALAKLRKPRAMILQSTFTSITAMAGRYLVPWFLLRDPFDNLEVVGQLKIPILVIHGTKDTLVPFEHAERLAKAAKHGKLVAYPCTHNSCPPDWDEYWNTIKTWFVQNGVLQE